MGDNIWLWDRNGVRTPMQWSDGPNAGFSAADPAVLYSPVIDDETYGYQHVNVRAQWADPGSLLNRMREMIRVRHAHSAFGRGEIRFLEAASPAILAYLRTHGNQTILCVHNLSSSPQRVELDLAAWTGAEPIDLSAEKGVPAITAGPYRLELQRYQYHWLRLP
jgi:maltose alpha-D-glucosyltransferase/alpha-amylase